MVARIYLLLYTSRRLKKGSIHTPHFPEVLKGETAEHCEQERTPRGGYALRFVEQHWCGYLFPPRNPQLLTPPRSGDTVCSRDQQRNRNARSLPLLLPRKLPVLIRASLEQAFKAVINFDKAARLCCSCLHHSGGRLQNLSASQSGL